MDRFSHLAIFSAVHCLLAGSRDLWRRFNNDENLLFREKDFQSPVQSELFRVLWESNDPNVYALVRRLAPASKQPLDEVPWVDQIVQSGQVKALAYVEQQAAAWAMAGERVLSQAVAAAGATPTSPATELPAAPALDDVFESAETATAAVNESPVYAPARGRQERNPADPRQRDRAGNPPLGNRIHAVGIWLWGHLAVVVRGFDALLRRLVGVENTILHNFLRFLIALTLIATLILGMSIYQQQRRTPLDNWPPPNSRPYNRKPSRKPRKKAEEDAARNKAEREAAKKKTEQEAPQKRAEEEAAQRKAEAEATARKKAEAEASRRKEEEEAAPGEGRRGGCAASCTASSGAGEARTAHSGRNSGEVEKMIPIDPRSATPGRLVEALPEPTIAVDLGNGTKLEVVLVTAGEFLMGSPNSDADASNDEKPQHRVRITRPFYLAGIW